MYTSPLHILRDRFQMLSHIHAQPPPARRTIRTQQFLKFSKEDIQLRKTKMEQAFAALQPPNKVVSRQQLEAFYERLVSDAQQRKDRKERLVAEKKAKEEELLR